MSPNSSAIFQNVSPGAHVRHSYDAFCVLSLDMTDVVGVDGRDETLVSNKGVADGWERRVIRKANGEGS